MTAPCQEVIYRLDHDNRLIFVNEEWHLFATANQADHLGGKAVHDRSIWEFIHDGETRQIHETLLNRVRTNKALFNLPFRCDAPALRRFMAMDILPLADGAVEYRCRLLRTEERDPVPLALDTAKEGQPHLRMCSWCKKIDTGADCWAEIEAAVVALDLLGPEMVPPISHTMCDACLAALEK